MDEKPQEIGIEQHYTPAQIAKKLGLSTSTVTRILKKEPGVFRYPHNVRNGLDRTHITLRVSETVLKRILEKYAIKSEYGPQRKHLRVLKNDR